MDVPRYLNDNGQMRFGKASPHTVNGIPLTTGNSTNTTTSVLSEIQKKINDMAPWDESNPVLYHRKASESFQALITTLIEADMMEGYSDYHYSKFCVKTASAAVAAEWNIPVGARYDVNYMELWMAGQG